MNISKILVTLGIIVAFLFIFGVLTFNAKSSGSSSPGIFGIILFIGLIAGLKAVWKKPAKTEEKDNHQLDKRE